MSFFFTSRIRLLLGLLAVSTLTLAMTGCSGGWGAAKPTISAIAGSATTVGQTETLTVSPAGTGPFTYQWYRNGVPVQGATSASYSLAATAADNGATYTVAVTNAGGTAVSAPFVLNLGVGPTITTQPASQTLNAGQAVTFTVTATGSATLTYQWTENGAPIPGATGASYTSGALAITDSGSTFGVIVTNAIGSVTSTQAAVTVMPLSPALAFNAVGNKTYSDPAFTVAATSPSAGAITYTVLSGPATVAGSVVTINGAGTVVLGATQQASGNYSAGTATTTFAVGKAQPVLALAPVQGQTYGTTVTTVATSTSPAAITYAVVSGPATISGNVLTATGTGTVVLEAMQAATSNYLAATATESFSVSQAASTLAFTPVGTHTFGDPSFPVSAANTSSGATGAIAYTVVSGPATVSGNTVTLTGVGTVVLSASQAASGNYAASSATTSFNVGAGTPALSFGTIPAHTYGDAPFVVAATSASTGAVTYAVVSGPATVNGNVVTITGVGTVVLSASQAASGNYAASSATTSFSVGAETPALSFGTIPAHTYGDAPFVVAATSASTGAVTYAVVSGPASVNGNVVTITGAGTVVVSASQAASGNYVAGAATVSFTASQATPVLTFATIPAHSYGDTAFSVNASSASSGAVTYTVVSGPATVAGNLVTLTGAGTVVLAASEAATSNYTAASATTSLVVNAATPNLALAGIPDQVYGASVTAAATSNSPGPITYSVSPSTAATISGATITTTNVGTVTVTASQAATSNYAAATKTTTFNVTQATPTLTFATIPAHTYGDAAFTVSASSASTGAVTYAVSSGPATIAGNTLTITGAGTVVLSATQAATSGYAAATASTQFNVASNVTISAISPAAQTVAPGQVTFSATATGGTTDNLNWSATGGTFNGAVWTAPTTAGTYTITATSADEPSVSVSTTATVSKPVITTQPVSKNACAGYSPSLTIAAKYASSYQWYYNGNTLANTSNVLTLSNVTTGLSGTYTCAAINDAGFATSNAVTLNVVTPTVLTITSQPASVSVYASQTATFAVGATGTGTLQYQWYKGAVGSGTLIAGATSRTYTTGALGASDSGSMFYVTVTDPDCTATTLLSVAATLTVSTTDTAVPPTIVTQPRAKTATVGGTATYSVVASGSGTLSYQWYRVAYTSTQLTHPTAGVLISGATSSTYTVPSTATAQSNDGDAYYVIVTNAYGSATSNRVGLSVGAGISLQISGQPQTAYIAANTLASFSVTATCTGCTAAYQWYWYAPGATTATALSNGAVSSGVLAGATITGANTSSLTLQTVPATATGGLVYVVVTSTSDGTSQISGTNPLTSTTAGLFVGSLGTVGNTTSGQGLCNSPVSNWVLNGTSPGTTSTSNVPYQSTSACTIEMTNGGNGEQAAVYWPTLISTANFSVSFTVQISSTGTPADGFTMVLADPSQGARTSTIGAVGEGLGANGIPGFVLGFDTFQNGNANGASGCLWAGAIPCDPVSVPYMAVGQGAASLWENPWTFVNGALDTQHSANYAPSVFANSTHSYVVSVVNRVMTVTMDGYELFTGTVSLPPAAYLGFTASTGGSVETVIISNLTATVSAP